MLLRHAQKQPRAAVQSLPLPMQRMQKPQQAVQWEMEQAAQKRTSKLQPTERHPPLGSGAVPSVQLSFIRPCPRPR